jgi:catechol-2,3-dioxygenase
MTPNRARFAAWAALGWLAECCRDSDARARPALGAPADDGREVVMMSIRGVYEVAVRVRDLATAETFYRQVLGLEVGLRDETRPWVFLRAGRNGMIVLQEDKADWPPQHFAFTVTAADIAAAASALRARGIPVEGPVMHDWIPATSLYFSDPDGHDLELCAPLG